MREEREHHLRVRPGETDGNAIIAAVTASRRIVDLAAQAEPIERVVARIYDRGDP